MNLPDITHLQFLVLSGLREGGQAGKALRDLLRQHGVKRSSPAFYQMMARLEDAGFVRGHYEQRVVDGQAIKERTYEITAAGDDAWKATCEFYRDTIGSGATETEHV